MQTYIVCVHRAPTGTTGLALGIVEDIESGQKKAFRNFNELQRCGYRRLVKFCALVIGVFLVMGAAQTQASAVVMEASISSPHGTLKDVAISGTGSSPYPDSDTTLTTIGTASIEYNNMGWRSSDGLLYALELTSSGNTGEMVTIDPTTGLVTSSTTISGGSASLTSSIRYDAGDVNNIDDVLYISNIADNYLYTADLTSGTFALSSTLITGGEVGAVDDWAYNPDDGNLWGVDITGQLARLNPVSGLRTDFGPTSGATLFASGVAYGAAWYDPTDGLLYFYRNADSATGAAIWQVDVSGTIDSSAILARYGSAGPNELHDGAYVVAAVPIPPSVWLFGTGLLGLVGIARRKNKTS